MTTKKELKDQYKQMRFDMGIIMLRCKPLGKAYLAISQNTKADINGLIFQLNLGKLLRSNNLQNDWKKYGEEGFEITVLESLSYDKDETKTDYAVDLKALRDLCSERFSLFEYIK